MAMKLLTVDKYMDAVKAIANYYRHEPIFVNEANKEDVYDWYIENYGDVCRGLVEQGYSYMYKGNYLLAIDLKELAGKDPDLFDKACEAVSHFIAYSVREENPIMYIVCFGPKGDCLTSDSYKLINEFVDKFRKSHVIYTDCFANVDYNQFDDYTGARQISINGCPFFRWSRLK